MARPPFKAGFLIDRWRPDRGGAEKALALLASHLERKGWEVHAFGAVGPGQEGEAPGIFHRVRVRALTRAGFERSLGGALVEAAREEGCRVTVGVRHLPRVDVFWTQNGILRGEFGEGPVRGRRRVFLDFEESLLERGGARKVACVSRLVLEEALRFYPACRDRLILVPNGIDLDRFRIEAREREGRALRKELGLPAERILLTFPGRDPVRKGLPALFRALKGLEDLPWTLLVAGPRKPGKWRRAARRLGWGPSRVAVRPHVEDLALAAGADLCVLPTRRDPCGLVILEALACGTPVITTSRAGAAEVMEGFPCGKVLEDPEDAPALREALGEWMDLLLAGAPGREEIREAVRDRGLRPWMESMEGLLLEAAREKGLNPTGACGSGSSSPSSRPSGSEAGEPSAPGPGSGRRQGRNERR